MLDFSKIKGFEWDSGNVDKSYLKHGITIDESEEIFLDENLQVLEDVKHSGTESRYVALGATIDNKILFVVYSIRENNIRVISARIASKKERKIYEQAKENS